MIRIIKPMEYAKRYEDCCSGKTEVLCDGIYKEYRFIILNIRGNHPCAYVEIPQGHPKYGVTDHDYWHVGPNEVTYGRNYLTDILKDTWVIGWDYNHWGDYSALDQCGKKWTTCEIIKECFEAIEDLIFMNSAVEEDDNNMEDDIMEIYNNMIKVSISDNEKLKEISEMLEDEEMKEKICKIVIQEAEAKNMRICQLLDELPCTMRWKIQHVIYDVQYEMKKPINIDKFANIEFIDIIEKPWALCGSHVVLKINDQEIEFDHILSTGGSVSWGERDEIEIGPWGVGNLPEYLEEYIEEITTIINDNVDWGCCGGCI